MLSIRHVELTSSSQYIVCKKGPMHDHVLMYVLLVQGHQGRQNGKEVRGNEPQLTDGVALNVVGQKRGHKIEVMDLFRSCTQLNASTPPSSSVAVPEVGDEVQDMRARSDLTSTGSTVSSLCESPSPVHSHLRGKRSKRKVRGKSKQVAVGTFEQGFERLKA
jgi:hypothetical protein